MYTVHSTGPWWWCHWWPWCAVVVAMVVQPPGGGGGGPAPGGGGGPPGGAAGALRRGQWPQSSIDFSQQPRALMHIYMAWEELEVARPLRYTGLGKTDAPVSWLRRQWRGGAYRTTAPGVHVGIYRTRALWMSSRSSIDDPALFWGAARTAEIKGVLQKRTQLARPFLGVGFTARGLL